MAKLKLASSTFLFFYFLSLPYALTYSNFPKALDIAPRDIPYDEDNLMAFDELDEKTDDNLTSKSEPFEIPNPIDLTEEKKETDNIPGSAPSEAIPFYHIHHHRNHQPRRSAHKEIPYGNDMILSHGNFENLAFKDHEGFNEEDNDLRRFHHHFDDGEVKGIEKKRKEHPHGYWFHQRKFGGKEEHPYYQKSHHRHHHHDRFEEEEKHEEGGLPFKLRKFLDWF